jgi:vacuolar-type H+-ATPase subunit F/Vma7
MLFPPRTQLQIVAVVGDDGVATLKPLVGHDRVAVVTLKPAVFQNISTFEEFKSDRKEGLRQLTSSLMWDLRNEADRDKELTPALVQRIDQLEQKLLTKYCKSDTGWYSENLKYKQAFQGLVREASEARKPIRDASSPLCKGLAAGGGTTVAPVVTKENMPSSAGSSVQVRSSNEVTVLHSK